MANLEAVHAASPADTGVNKSSSNGPAEAGRPDLLTSARYQPPSNIHLVFADGLTGAWSFDTLDLETDDLRLESMRASKSGTSIEVENTSGAKIELDSSWLRALVDPAYAAALEKEQLAKRGPLEDLTIARAVK